MKTALLTLGLTAVFFGIGLVVTRVVMSTPAEDGEAPPTATVEASADSTGHRPADEGEVDDLVVELEQMQVRLAEAEARADSLRHLIDGRQAEQAESKTSAADLASTLSKMEDEALAAVVQRLDGRSFVQLYDAASSRNRSRLLDALTPPQAAAFVRHQLPDGSPAPLHTASAGGVARDSSSATR